MPCFEHANRTSYTRRLSKYVIAATIAQKGVSGKITIAVHMAVCAICRMISMC